MCNIQHKTWQVLAQFLKIDLNFGLRFLSKYKKLLYDLKSLLIYLLKSTLSTAQITFNSYLCAKL